MTAQPALRDLVVGTWEKHVSLNSVVFLNQTNPVQPKQGPLSPCIHRPYIACIIQVFLDQSKSPPKQRCVDKEHMRPHSAPFKGNHVPARSCLQMQTQTHYLLSDWVSGQKYRGLNCLVYLLLGGCGETDRLPFSVHYTSIRSSEKQFIHSAGCAHLINSVVSACTSFFLCSMSSAALITWLLMVLCSEFWIWMKYRPVWSRVPRQKPWWPHIKVLPKVQIRSKPEKLKMEEGWHTVSFWLVKLRQ